MRVKINLEGTNIEEFFIDGFPSVPRKKELIDIGSMISESNFSENELNKIYDFSWHVWFVAWETDKQGIYPKLYCCGN